MSIETVIRNRTIGEVIRRAGRPDTVIERWMRTELVTRNIGAQGGRGAPGPGLDDIELPDLKLIFEGALL